MAEASRGASCSTCLATFTSVAHLRRHEKSHVEDRLFACPFCSDLFTRSDSARRHTTTCARRNGRPVPTPRKRGRKRQACDTCASTKSACDAQQPCSGCVKREAVCTYAQAIVPAAAPAVDLCMPSVPASCVPALNLVTWTVTATQHRTVRMSFLLHYTNPRNDTLQEYFHTSAARADYEENEESRAPAHGDACDGLSHPDLKSALDGAWEGASISWKSVEPGAFNVALPSELSATWWTSPHVLLQDMHLGLRITEIVYTLRSKLSAHTSPADAAAWTTSALSIFQVDNVDRFVQAYFDNWHRHCPLLHRSSFDAKTSFTPLLTAILLIGALYWSEPSAAAARTCLDAAERYIFEHEAFRRLLCPPQITTRNSTRVAALDLEPLQAGFLIAVAQHWENHRDSRRRVRLHRYADMIAAARYLGLPNLRHDDGGDAGALIKTEEGIRLMSWIFLVDSSHAIFHRTTPRLTLGEMTGSMPGHEICFDQLGIDADGWRCHVPKISSLEHGISLLMGETWTAEAVAMFGQLSHLDLFLLVSGLHELLFALRIVWPMPAQHATLDRALSRWRVLWDLHAISSPSSPSSVSSSPYSLSFIRHADEYWLLAKLMLRERMSLVSDDGTLDQDGMDGVHNYIKQFATVCL